MTKIGKIIELPKRLDRRGNLTVAEEMKDIPFNIARVYWVYDVPGGENRGGHSHKHCREFIIAAKAGLQRQGKRNAVKLIRRRKTK